MTDEMKAGRELDARVAECVMGKQAASWGGFGLMEDAERIAVDLPHYSTDIAAAWLVMDEMDRRGFHGRLTTPFEPGQPYFAGFTPHGMSGWNGRPDHEGSGDTPSLAICRAALAAVGHATPG
jgi:hypothetical protein